MNNNELEDNSIEKISYSKQKKKGIKFSRSANSFVSWCKNTIMSSVVLTTIKLAWGGIYYLHYFYNSI
mgnify:CR=1 FL=1